MGVIGASPDAAARVIDGMAPRRVIQAERDGDVVDAIRAANADGEAIVIWGGGTRIGIGDAPMRYDTALDVGGLRGIVAHEPEDLTVTVWAGTTIAELQGALAAHGQWWPVEVAHAERATVGGTIASAAGGPARYRYFHPRDWTIGVRAVLGDGTLTKAGGRVVKNVTGYDLTRLYSGSYGTLCAIVEATLKLTALPERSVTLRADLPDPAFGFRAVRDLVRERPAVDAIGVVTGPAAEALGCPTWTALFVRVAGVAAAVERVRSQIDRRFGAVEVEPGLWSRIADLPADAETSVRGTWPPGMAIEAYAVSSVWYPGVETLHLLDDHGVDGFRALRHAAEAQSGALVLERVSAETRRALGTWGTPRLPVAIARRLREQLDPRGVLAPGRVP